MKENDGKKSCVLFDESKKKSPLLRRDAALVEGDFNHMKKSTKKLYTRKRPAHPDEAHTGSKRWFKKKGRKAVRKHLKKEMENEKNKT